MAFSFEILNREEKPSIPFISALINKSKLYQKFLSRWNDSNWSQAPLQPQNLLIPQNNCPFYQHPLLLLKIPHLSRLRMVSISTPHDFCKDSYRLSFRKQNFLNPFTVALKKKIKISAKLTSIFCSAFFRSG